MASGRSLHIGLNAVDPKHYQGWDGKLVACEYDAEDMRKLAVARGIEPRMLLTKDATRDALLTELRAAAKALEPGDLFFVTYSGHGGRLPDVSGDEIDGMDETWCLFDSELLDDELYAAWARFSEGVRVVVLSDSCHSGSVVKLAFQRGLAPAAAGEDSRAPAVRAMPLELMRKVYEAHRAFYDENAEASKGAKAADIRASVLLISGCQDNQFSSDGAFNGLFTGTLLRVWRGGKFKGDYRRLHRSILRRMPPEQSPNYMLIGRANPDFESQQPFTVEP